MNDLNNELKNILEQKIEAENKVFSYNEAVAQKIIPEEFKVGYVRVIGFGDASFPCGGTHVSNTAEIGNIQVTKVQKKGKNVRVQYRVDDLKKE
jgi:Ser-tRNA(Ala) deacylase AlaX